jgi:hypothetical protein
MNGSVGFEYKEIPSMKKFESTGGLNFEANW